MLHYLSQRRFRLPLAASRYPEFLPQERKQLFYSRGKVSTNKQVVNADDPIALNLGDRPKVCVDGDIRRNWRGQRYPGLFLIRTPVHE
jgi:hypothetical protein